MSAKKIFISRFLLAATFFCGSLGTAYYVSHHYLHRSTPRVNVAENAVKNIRKDAFADKLSNKLIKVANYTPPTRQPVIFDNDAASDDFMALMLIGNDPRIDLKAITVAGTGEAHGEAGARNMADAAYLLGKPTMPIAFGRGAPLSDAGVMFPEDDRVFVDHLLDDKNVPHHPAPVISANAVGLMHDVLSGSKDQVTILATGPLTNVAELIKKYPDSAARIKRVVVMGGAINVPGNLHVLDPDNKNHVSEWNFYADPEAVKIVFNSKIPVILVALDATNQVRVSEEFYRDLGKQEEPDLQLVYKLHQGLVKRFGMQTYKKDIYMWDALAAMVMLEPEVAVVSPVALTVNRDNGSLRAAASADQAAIINVVTSIPQPKDVLKKYIAVIKSNHIYAQQKFHDAVWHRTANLNTSNKRDINYYAGTGKTNRI
jgi:pyrimidine-specific ribonucleoside hydrolase